MDPATLAIVAFALMLVLLLLAMPVGPCMAIIGFGGMCLLIGPEPAIARLAIQTFTTSSIFLFTVVPLFILMGLLAAEARLGDDIFVAAHTWLGRLPGGLAAASALGSTAFGAVCGDAIAGGVTMSSVALPQMRRYGYKDTLSLGTLCSGGLLGYMIPPSLALIVFSFFTDEPIGLLFAAGLMPGLLIAALFIVTIFVLCKRDPTLGPQGSSSTWKEKFVSLRYAWTIIAVFVAVLGGIYAGIFTPTEAGAEGAFAILVFGFIFRRWTWERLRNAFGGAVLMTGMIFLMIFGAMAFKDFLALTEVPMNLAAGIAASGLSALTVLAVILALHIILGLFMPVLAIMVLTLPLLFPVLVALDINILLFAVLMVLVVMIGALTPPVGIVVFVLCGYAQVPIMTGFRGVMPFIIAMLVGLVILIAFPEITLFLPKLISPGLF
ncbi:MAG: TRAP transporter large permease [Dehalococcoidia bacterium]|nr:TRAP transporter large permease [Dehalococcoidia bacterium]